MRKKKFIPIAVSTPEGLEVAVADYVKLKLLHAAAKAALELEFYGIQAFCQANRGTMFPEARKSLDWPMATLGFRTNPPSVGTRRKSITFCAAAKLLLTSDWGRLFVRYPDPAIDKEAILAARGKLTEEQLSAVGLVIEQDEEFFIQPRSEIVAGDKSAELVV